MIILLQWDNITFSWKVVINMGFDLYGLKPKIKKDSVRPPAIDWNKCTDKEKKKYFKISNQWETDNVGIYFRNNVWWWRPLADLVEKLCFFLDDKEKEHLHHNGGYQYDEATAHRIADALEAFVKSSVAKRTVIAHNKARKKAEAHNKKVSLKLKALDMDAIARTGNKKIAPCDYPKDLHDKWENIYREHDHTASYPFSLKNVKEFVKFLRQCGGFSVC